MDPMSFQYLYLEVPHSSELPKGPQTPISSTHLQPNKLSASAQNQQKYSSSKWKLSQNLRYSSFLSMNPHLFTGCCSSTLRRRQKIHVKMAQFVGSRSIAQCRSHHQKMIKHHKDIAGIIRFIDSLTRKENRQYRIETKNPQKSTQAIKEQPAKHQTTKQRQVKTQQSIELPPDETDLLWNEIYYNYSHSSSSFHIVI